jgi:hypothetical protein
MSTTTVSQGAPEAPRGERPAPGFRRLKSETLQLSRDEGIAAAHDHLALPHSPTERSLDKSRVRYLVGQAKLGLWLPCHWGTVMFEGVKYRMNGQHSSDAMVEAGDDLPETIAIHLDHYTSENAHGMGLLFRQFDARISGRSKQDVSGAYQGLVREIADIPRKKAKLGLEGIGWFERSVERLPVPAGDDLYEAFFRAQYHPFLKWLDVILSIKTPELMRPPIVGAMYHTFITSESGAQDFWTHVAKQDLPDDSDARSVLSAELVRIKEDRGRVEKTAPAEFYAKCIKAWNAFRAGEKIRSLNVNTKKGLPPIAA